jgi:hypothetical protein
MIAGQHDDADAYAAAAGHPSGHAGVGRAIELCEAKEDAPFFAQRVRRAIGHVATGESENAEAPRFSSPRRRAGSASRMPSQAGSIVSGALLQQRSQPVSVA